MASLRRRFLLGSRLLLALQVLTSGLVLASWLSVVRVSEGLSALSAWRLSVLAFGAAAREQYVHQAHSFVEGGAGHLDHYTEAAQEAEARLGALSVVAVPEATGIHRELTQHHAAFTRWFAEQAVPALQVGLDRSAALALHSEAEARVSRLEADTQRLLEAVETRQTAEQVRLTAALQRAVVASVVLAGLAAVVQLGVGRRLASAVLEPLGHLAEVATRFGQGERGARADEGGDDELAALAVRFNTMFNAVTAAEDRRVRAERLAALGELSAAIAHELNNPLTVILGRTNDPAVRAEAEHASRVVRGLLGFARPGEEPAGPVDLGALAAEAVSRQGPWADARDLRLELHTHAPLRALSSPSAARQILDNLLRNAIEAAPAGTTIEVHVGSDAVRVLDRGPGLPASLRHRLYEPFATDRADGTGLGLAVCQRIARAQGGALQHQDRPGGGTVAEWRPGGAA